VFFACYVTPAPWKLLGGTRPQSTTLKRRQDLPPARRSKDAPNFGTDCGQSGETSRVDQAEELAMAKDQNPAEEMNAVMKQAMQTMEGATEQYVSWLQKGMSTPPWLDTDLSKKMMGFVQQNMAASFGFMQKLGQAKDFQDLVRIQTEFLQTQLESFGKQVRDISEASTKVAAAAIKPPAKSP
jgi:phasin